MYTYADSMDKLNILTSINIEGQTEYYLCMGDQQYIFTDKTENKINTLQEVGDTNLKEYCK